ncbi:MAG: N-acetylmuramoyl-L-alanine amidase [Firmicutes bacterium]|nr:N-acetylmuramoyl-L-alanine amidase [Bacillota bacterium]
MPKVILDAGHGGSDVGDYYENRSEKNDNLKLALRIGQFLQQKGIEVGYTRTSDVYLSMVERANIANKLGGDFLLSIHRLSGNTYSDKPGLDFFVGEDAAIAEEGAKNIGDELKESGYENYGIIVRTDVPLINDVKMPSVMAGIGYFRSEQENLNYDEKFSDIAEEIAEGIYRTLVPSNEDDMIVQENRRRVGYFHRIGVGPYRSYNEAMNHQHNISLMGFETEIIKLGARFFIYVGMYDNPDDAVKVEILLRRYGFCSFMICI